jgi:hypothetical protein
MRKNESLRVGARIAAEVAAAIGAFIGMSGVLIYPILQAGGYLG